MRKSIPKLPGREGERQEEPVGIVCYCSFRLSVCLCFCLYVYSEVSFVIFVVLSLSILAPGVELTLGEDNLLIAF